MRAGLEALPDEYRRTIIIWVSAIVLFAGFLAVLGKRFDWQRLEPSQTCPHCLRVHSATGIASAIADGIMLTALAVLGVEPFCAALRAEDYPLLDIAIVALIVLAALAILIGFGFILRLPTGDRSGTAHGDILANLLAGTRVTALVLSAWMFTQGFGRAAVAFRLSDLFGSRLGQRLQLALDAAAIRDALVVMLAGCILSTLARWIVPVIAGSKPLVLMMPKPTSAVTA